MGNEMYRRYLVSALKEYRVYDSIKAEFPDLDNLLRNVTFRFSGKLSRSAGLFKIKVTRENYTEIPGSAEVVVSQDLLREGFEGFLNDTIRHETAHALCFRVRGYAISHLSEDHGPVWQSFAVRCGAKPKKCQDIPFDKLAQCAKLGKPQTRTRVPREIFCTRCGEILAVTLRNLPRGATHRNCGGLVIKR